MHGYKYNPKMIQISLDTLTLYQEDLSLFPSDAQLLDYKKHVDDPDQLPSCKWKYKLCYAIKGWLFGLFCIVTSIGNCDCYQF